MLLIQTTIPTRDEALRLVHELVEQHLVACAQLSDIESTYLRAGKLQQEPECRLLLLGAGIVLQVGAAILTPTPLQKWVSRSYFGKDDDKYPKGDWTAELKGLNDALHEAQNAQ